MKNSATRITISRKLTIMVGAILLLFSAMGITSYIQVSKIDEGLLDITQVEEPASLAALEMEIYLLAAARATLAYTIDREEKAKEQVRASQLSFEKYQQQLSDLPLAGSIKQLLPKLASNYTQFKEHNADLIRMADEEATMVNQFHVALQRLQTLIAVRAKDYHTTSTSALELPGVAQSSNAEKEIAILLMEIDIIGISKDLSEFLYEHTKTSHDDQLALQDDFEKRVISYEALNLTLPEKEWIAQIHKDFDGVISMADEILVEDKARRDLLVTYASLQTSMDQVLGTDIQQLTHSLLTTAKTDAHSAVKGIQKLIIGLVCGGIIIGLLLAIGIGKGILSSITSLIEGARQVRAGNFSKKVELRSNDELSDLAECFNEMADTLNDQQRTVGEAIGRLQRISNDLLGGTSTQGHAMEAQSASIAETVATANQVAQTAELAADRARVVTEVVKKTVEIGTKGQKAVNDSVIVMDKVRQQVTCIAESNLNLAERAQAIGEIISSVNDIADQTNLLALNAAVEAARAGEGGRGFGVVASEIKSLAEQSKTATEQVAIILGDIQKATNTAVMSTEQGTRDADEAALVVKEAGTTIQSLIESLAQTSEMAGQIVTSSEQQAMGVKQVNEAMGELEKVSQQQFAARHTVEEAMREIISVGEELGSLIDTKPSRQPEEHLIGSGGSSAMGELTGATV